mmetsp:Transcript_24338/g.76789  ORF Transcript_24338/g.76789 Transcript_24338/m.76789 type:complete len:290 (-) Transcript_24338:2445-3314(-)
MPTRIGTNDSMEKALSDSSVLIDSTSQSWFRDSSCRSSSPSARRPTRIPLSLACVADAPGMISSSPAPSFRRSPWRALLADARFLENEAAPRSCRGSSSSSCPSPGRSFGGSLSILAPLAPSALVPPGGGGWLSTPDAPLARPVAAEEAATRSDRPRAGRFPAEGGDAPGGTADELSKFRRLLADGGSEPFSLSFLLLFLVSMHNAGDLRYRRPSIHPRLPLCYQNDDAGREQTRSEGAKATRFGDLGTPKDSGGGGRPWHPTCDRSAASRCALGETVRARGALSELRV